MITQLTHVGLEVDNVDKAIKFYESMGFQVALQFDKPAPQAKVAHMVSANNVKLELWQFIDKAHPQVEFIRRHIALESDDLEADLDKLVREGCQIAIPVTKGVTMTYAFIRDTDGNYIEISQK